MSGLRMDSRIWVKHDRLLPLVLLLPLGIITMTFYRHWQPADDGTETTIGDIEKLLGEINMDVTCPARGKRLKLGEEMAWSPGPELGQTNACIFCTCTVRSVEDEPTLQCEIHDCPYDQCVLSEESFSVESAYRPDHPCCLVCGNSSSSPASEPPPPQLTIDERVPYTRDIYQSHFRHRTADPCPATDGHQNPTAIMAVLSQPRAIKRRAAFRQLYSKLALSHGIRIIFVLGREAIVDKPFNDFREAEFEYEDEGDEAEAAKTKAEAAAADRRSFATWQRNVDAEVERFDDILQSNITEHYYHLGLKTLSVLDYVRQVRHICPTVRHLVKTDDDIGVTMRRLVEELVTMRMRPMSIHGQHCRTECKPSRMLSGWYSSDKEWPWREYPPFVMGPGYVVSADAVDVLYRTALDTRYHHLEDVFITGIVAEASGVQRFHWEKQCANYVVGGDVCMMNACALSHRVPADEAMRTLSYFQYADDILDLDSVCQFNGTILQN